MDDLLKPPPGPPPLEKGESDVERMVKYLHLAQIAARMHPPETNADLGLGQPQAHQLWEDLCGQAEQGVPYSQMISSVNLASISLRAMGVGYREMLGRLVRSNTSKLMYYLTELQDKIEQSLASFPLQGYQSNRYYPIGVKLDKLRAEAIELNKRAPAIAEAQIRLVNRIAILEARLNLLELQRISIDNSPPPGPVKGTVIRVRTKLGFSLAKANEWEGAGFDRITSRRAEMYRIAVV